MKYCHNCKIYRPKDSKFCTRCGSSFDVKYCRKLHPNAATAEYCNVCGSSDLSTPHKRRWKSGGSLLLAVVIGIVLATVAVWFIVNSMPDYDMIPSWEILLVLALVACATVIWSERRH